MTPAQQQAARIEKDVEAVLLGLELMQPMPPKWRKSIFELRGGAFAVCAVDENAPHTWPARADYEVKVSGEGLAKMHEACREQAWAKHKKNTGEA